MPRTKTLSNRQRKLQQKAVQARPYAVVLQPRVTAPVTPEPKGEALRQATLAEVRMREAERTGGAADVSLDRAGHIRANNRDGIAQLFRSGGLTEAQTKAALAFRHCYEASKASLKSCLGKAGEGGGGRRIAGLTRSAAELHRSVILAHLNRMELAVAQVMVDGRELHALREVAGERKTVREVAGSSGHARAATTAALVRALDAIAQTLRITGQ